MTAMFDDQAVHVSYIIDEVLKRGHRTIEASAEAEGAWVAEIVRLAGSGATAFRSAANSSPIVPGFL